MLNTTNDEQRPTGKVMIVGVFDLLHRGHVEFVRQAARFGDEMVVIINGDSMVSEYKRKPLFCEEDRLAIMQSLRWVDEAAINNSFDLKPMVEKFRPAVIVHGDDWPRAGYLEQIRMTEEDLVDYGVELAFIPYYSRMSTSGLIRKIQGMNVG